MYLSETYNFAVKSGFRSGLVFGVVRFRRVSHISRNYRRKWLDLERQRRGAFHVLPENTAGKDVWEERI